QAQGKSFLADRDHRAPLVRLLETPVRRRQERESRCNHSFGGVTSTLESRPQGVLLWDCSTSNPRSSYARGATMLHIGKPTDPKRHPATPRELLRVGGIGLLGVTLADWCRGRDLQASPSSRSRGREPSCIFIFLSGGPSHLETFDPKPNAPVNIRGPYGTTPTNVSRTPTAQLPPPRGP